jgi:deoxyribonuclease-4
MQILLGPAGSPIGNTLDGIAEVKRLGLQAMEVQFSHGIGMGLELARRVGNEQKRLGIKLSVHAPYYINLASEDKKKTAASVKRIMDSCKLAHLMNASPVIFHPAYFGKRNREDVYDIVKNKILEIKNVIKKNRWDTSIGLETTGKHSAFGSLEETLDMARKTKSDFCVDFAHLYARNNGKIDYSEILNKIKTKHLHVHFSNIKYSAKGELSHLVLDHSPDFKPLAQELMKRKQSATIICESPITWKDSLKMKKIFETLGYNFK